MYALEINQLSKVFQGNSGEVVALEDIQFKVKHGEFISIVGTSGCGKSTLLNIIAGLSSHTSGTVLVNGVSVSGPGSDRAVVFQSDAIFPWLSVSKNIEYGMKVKKMPKEERRQKSEELLKLLELEKFRDAYPREMSVECAKELILGGHMLLNLKYY